MIVEPETPSPGAESYLAAGAPTEEEERGVRARVRAFAEREVVPIFGARHSADMRTAHAHDGTTLAPIAEHEVVGHGAFS